MTDSPFDRAGTAPPGAAPAFPNIPPAATGEPRVGDGRNLDSILRIPVLIQVVLGSATMPVADLMKLGRGAIVPLDHRVGEPVDITVNGRVVARGEIVVVEEDNSRFGVSLTEIVGPADAGQNG
ncbi:flagellar motor switch protein FliN [Methylobacterium sp. Leaf399]|uniref:flagellar motor switch protein FliN n=1 Tax=unclassified Methylobacterium TaxID=2615210 RepID=UPI0006FCF32F|nr:MULTISPECIES: flagellar motor switch protein FliN [unclassified Methylobacterium]KQP55209.1 flagellar motor switch protein FliN [Methylobacterium sp. Leaf108]KQT09949.1 flagellar motor switch protein FliN [Methylobacterium sp. Leaf399]KQT87563.1 flagellar motor switch protein FliN [Methylobacterium sp. Leaf466]